MSAWKGLREILFWAAVLLGTGVLAPSLILPAWLEREGQLEYLKQQQAYMAALQYRLEATRAQIDHFEHDPAYVLRLAHQEFGGSIKLPESDMIRVAPGAQSAAEGAATPGLANGMLGGGAAGPGAGDASLGDGAAGQLEGQPAVDDVLPELSSVLESVVQRYPHVQMFVDYRRVPIMAVGGILLLTAVLLMGLTDGDAPRRARSGRAART